MWAKDYAQELSANISYDKLWKLLIDKKMNRTDMKDASGYCQELDLICIRHQLQCACHYSQKRAI